MIVIMMALIWRLLKLCGCRGKVLPVTDIELRLVVFFVVSFII